MWFVIAWIGKDLGRLLSVEHIRLFILSILTTRFTCDFQLGHSDSQIF